jgi:hypothetical protein
LEIALGALISSIGHLVSVLTHPNVNGAFLLRPERMLVYPASVSAHEDGIEDRRLGPGDVQ